MGRAITSGQLQLKIEIAKKREAARLATKLSSTPKPYTKKPPTEIILANMVSNPKVFVKIPVPEAVLAKLPDGVEASLGMKPASSTAAELGAGSSIVDFAGNHKKVLRVTVYPGVPATSKVTAWGTRVVKKVSESFSFPVGGASIDAVITAFQAAFTGSGPAKLLMGTAGNDGYAVLRLGNTVLSKAQA